MIYGRASSFIYDYNDDGNITFHSYGYGFWKKLQAAPNRELSRSSPASACRHQWRACHCLLIFLASQASQYLESKMSCLCHTAMCHVCPQTIPLIHHRRQLLAVTSTLLMGSSVNAWWRFLCVSCYRAAALGPAAIRPQPVLSQAESCMHTASSLADWLLSRAAGKGQCDAVWLCIYIVIITLTAGLQADQTVCPN